MRFYKPVIKDPISTFVEAPLDFIQNQMAVEQKGIDEAEKSIQDLNKEYLGVKPGLFSKDLYNQFKTKYENKFSDLTEELMNDPSKAPIISSKIAKLNSEFKSDSLYNEISKDFMNYTQAMQKLAGSDKPYYFNRTSQLKLNPDGTVESSSPSDYMALTDKGAYNTLFEQVAKLKPEVYEENGKKYVNLINPDGTYTQQEIKTEKDVEVLRLSRINKYLEDAFATTNTDGSFEYHYRDAAERLGNPALAKNSEFRKQIYNQIVEPIKQQAYQKVQTAETINNLNTASIKTSKGAGGDGTIPTPEQSGIVSGTTSAKKAGYVSSKTGNNLGSLQDLEEEKSFLKQQSVQAVDLMRKSYKDVTGKELSGQQTYSNLFNQFKIEGSKIVPKEGFLTNENSNLASDYNFQQAYINFFNKRQQLANLEGYEQDIKRAAGVDKYNPQVLKEAENKAKAEIYNSNQVKNPLSEKAALEQFNNLSLEEQESLKLKFKDKYRETIKNNIPKNSNEYKIYEAFEKANQRVEDVELRQLPSKNAQGNDLKALLLQNVDIDKAGQFRYINTNEVVDIKELREGLPKDENGKIDYSQVEMGYFADPNEGMKGYLSVPINGAYKRIEFPMETSSLQSIVMSLDPTEAVRFRVYNEGIKSIQESYGQKGKIKITDDFEFNFSETNIDDKDKGILQKYKYIDAKGITRYADSYREMFNDLYSAYTEMNFTSSENLRSLYTELLNQYNNKKIDQITFNQKMSEAINKEKLRMQNSPMGKNLPQNQDPLLLGQ